MSSRLLRPDEYELRSRSSSVDSHGSFNLDEADYESQMPHSSRNGAVLRLPWLSRLFSNFGYRRLKSNSRRVRPSSRRRCFSRRRCCYHLHMLFWVIFALVLFASIFIPSYTNPPAHYATLRQAVLSRNYNGRGNTRNEKVFIAASIYDKGGDLASGQWGTQLLQLIDMLGDLNVFVSIYENDSGEEGQSALRELERQIPSRKKIIFEEHFDRENIPSVTIPGGEKRIKRIEYLAQLRNRALQPLEEEDIHYDKLLYLNDIMFDPIDALQLLFSTNANDGRAQYRAACAVDFDNPFKFYDTYATRDLQGYSMGLPFFPWFSSKSESRKDVLQGKDAVRVRSCWGGMVAFDAKYFQPSQTSRPVQFRSGPDLFWEASECCLIHADIQDAPTTAKITDTGIYMNPYVRVAYDRRTLSWLSITRRWEKLYSLIHNIGNHLVGLPWYNPRRAEQPGEKVRETVWVPDPAGTSDGSGSFQLVDRIAGNDGFCGRRGLQVIVENRKPGQKGFEGVPVPS